MYQVTSSHSLLQQLWQRKTPPKMLLPLLAHLLLLSDAAAGLPFPTPGLRIWKWKSCQGLERGHSLHCKVIVVARLSENVYSLAYPIFSIIIIISSSLRGTNGWYNVHRWWSKFGSKVKVVKNLLTKFLVSFKYVEHNFNL